MLSDRKKKGSLHASPSTVFPAPAFYLGLMLTLGSSIKHVWKVCENTLIPKGQSWLLPLVLPFSSQSSVPSTGVSFNGHQVQCDLDSCRRFDKIAAFQAPLPKVRQLWKRT